MRRARACSSCPTTSARSGALVEPLSVGLHGVNPRRSNRGWERRDGRRDRSASATLIWCKAKGASAVIVSELAPGRTELAMKLGATEVVNPTESDPAERCNRITGRPPEIVFECIGVKSTLGAAIGMVGRLGQVVVIGVCMEPDKIIPLRCVMKEVRSISCWATRARIPGNDRRAGEGQDRRDPDGHRRNRRRPGARDVRRAEAPGHPRQGDGGVPALSTSNRERSPASFLRLRAGVTPAQGSVKPTAGFTLRTVISPSPRLRKIL